MHVTRTIRTAATALALFALAILTGCASVTLPPPTAQAGTVEKLRATPLQKANVGAFRLAAGKPDAMDRTAGGLRGSTLSASGGSFAGHLKAELETALKAAGLYEASSPAVVSGELTDTQLDAAIGTGTARLAARFVVQRSGRVLYDRELSVDSSWESSFVGAVALPLAINQYGALYKALVDKLVSDPAFRAALAPG